LAADGFEVNFYCVAKGSGNNLLWPVSIRRSNNLFELCGLICQQETYRSSIGRNGDLGELDWVIRFNNGGHGFIVLTAMVERV